MSIVFLTGTIDFKSAMLFRQKGEKHIDEESTVTFDFKQVTHANSVGLTLMLAWLRYAKQAKKTIGFIHLPESLKMMADICNVSEILGMK